MAFGIRIAVRNEHGDKDDETQFIGRAVTMNQKTIVSSCESLGLMPSDHTPYKTCSSRTRCLSCEVARIEALRSISGVEEICVKGTLTYSPTIALIY